METATDFIFLGSKITVDGDCSHEIKRQLFLGRKAMTNLDSTICKTHSQWEFAVRPRKLKQGLCIILGMGREMGGSFKREGIYVYLWLIHVEV